MLRAINRTIGRCSASRLSLLPEERAASSPTGPRLFAERRDVADLPITLGTSVMGRSDGGSSLWKGLHFCALSRRHLLANAILVPGISLPSGISRPRPGSDSKSVRRCVSARDTQREARSWPRKYLRH